MEGNGLKIEANPRVGTTGNESITIAYPHIHTFPSFQPVCIYYAFAFLALSKPGTFTPSGMGMRFPCVCVCVCVCLYACVRVHIMCSLLHSSVAVAAAAARFYCHLPD